MGGDRSEIGNDSVLGDGEGGCGKEEEALRTVVKDVHSIGMQRKDFRDSGFLMFDLSSFSEEILGGIMGPSEYERIVREVNGFYDNTRLEIRRRKLANFYLLLISAALCVGSTISVFIVAYKFEFHRNTEISLGIAAGLFLFFTVCLGLYLWRGAFMSKKTLFKRLQLCDRHVESFLKKISESKYLGRGVNLRLSYVYTLNCFEKGVLSSSSKSIVVEPVKRDRNSTACVDMERNMPHSRGADEENQRPQIVECTGSSGDLMYAKVFLEMEVLGVRKGSRKSHMSGTCEG